MKLDNQELHWPNLFDLGVGLLISLPLWWGLAWFEGSHDDPAFQATVPFFLGALTGSLARASGLQAFHGVRSFLAFCVLLAAVLVGYEMLAMALG